MAHTVPFRNCSRLKSLVWDWIIARRWFFDGQCLWLVVLISVYVELVFRQWDDCSVYYWIVDVLQLCSSSWCPCYQYYNHALPICQSGMSVHWVILPEMAFSCIQLLLTSRSPRWMNNLDLRSKGHSCNFDWVTLNLVLKIIHAQIQLCKTGTNGDRHIHFKI